MAKMDKRLQALERKCYPVLDFADRYDEEKITAHQAKYGIDPKVKGLNDMYHKPIK